MALRRIDERRGRDTRPTDTATRDPHSREGRGSEASTTQTGTPSTGLAQGPEIQALALLQGGLGNQFFAEASSPRLSTDLSSSLGSFDSEGGASALLQQHTMGSLAMAMAGFEGAESLVPGQAPLSVMRQLMRRNQAESEGLDVGKAADRIGKRGGQPLPEAVRLRMERAFGHDFSHVRIHTDGGAHSAADALHAMAFAIGRDIYFSRGAFRPGTAAGDELLAHELTHVVQADENRLPSTSGEGLDVSSPTDRHEREAMDMGRQVAHDLGAAPAFDAPADSYGLDAAPQVDGAGSSGAASAQDGLALRETRPGAAAGAGNQPASSGNTEAGPTHATLVIAGKPIEVRLPAAEERQATVEVTLDERPVTGLHLTGATLDMNEEGAVVGGTVRGTVELDGAFQGTVVSLGILPGGTIAPGVQDVPFTLGPASGTLDLQIGRDGLSGSGTVAAAELGLPAWVGIEGGSLEIALAAGQFSGQGTLQGTPTPHGTAVLAASLQGTTLTAQVTYTLTPGQQPIPGVVVESGVLTGTLTKVLGQAEEAGDGAGAPATGAATDGRAAAAAIAPNTTAAAPSGEASPTPSMAGPGETPDQEASPGGTLTPVTAAPGAAPVAPGALVLNGTAVVNVRDWVRGEVEVGLSPDAGTFNVSGTLSASQEMHFGELVAVRSTLSLVIANNEASEAKALVDFTAPRIIGKITADYDIAQHSLSGQATARLSHNWPLEAPWGEFRLLRGGRLDAIVTANELSEITGRVRFDALVNGLSETPLDLSGTVEGRFDTQEDKVNGAINGKVDSDFTLQMAAAEGEGGAQSLTLLAESAVRGTVTDNSLSQIGLDANLRYDRDGAPFMSGVMPGAVFDVERSQLSGEGTFTLLTDIERRTRGGQWGLKVLAGSQLTATVAASQLTRLGGTLNVTIDDGQGPLLNGTVDDATFKVAEGTISGQVKLTTARKFYYPGEGQLLPSGYALEVLPGSGVRGTLKDDALTDVGASLRTMVMDGEGSLARLSLEADWDLEKDEVDGKGTLSLARNLVVAEGMGEDGWVAKLKRGSKAVGHIENNDFTKVDGELKGSVEDAAGEFLEINGTGQWTTTDDLLDLRGTVTVSREKELASTESGWQVALMPGVSTATATIEDDVFQGIDGSIATKVRKDGADFALLTLVGHWNETNGFTGEGGAELLTDLDVAQVGAYHLWVVKGAGASIQVENDQISQIGGTVPVRLDEGDQAFMRGYIEGTYHIEERLLSGSGRAELLIERQLGSLGEDQLWIIPSSNATATFQDNQLTEVGGEMNLSARDTGGEYGRIRLGGTFDAAGGTGFSGMGDLEVVREKQLYAMGDYSFWLKPGAGATAHVFADQLVRIDGDVPFMVRDGGDTALIEGAVHGVYDPATGQINGTGNVTLGRDVDYDLGGGTVLKVKAGSGGDADVVDSKLTRLGGTLTAELWRDGEGIVSITANGEYNVLTQTLTRLEGAATLLKPLSMADGAIVLSNVAGHATIVENQLVSAGGTGQMVVAPLNNMQGEFTVEWSNTSGRDVYSGSGWLDFTLIDRDPATGRGMSGRITAEYHEDDTFNASGEINYQIIEAIGGTLNAEVDQNWDPTIGGNMIVDTNLVEARDLFNMERDLLPEQTIRLPYGLALFVGMRGGMSMAMDALSMYATIGVSDWKPLSQSAEVPNFEAALDLGWGMNFNAMVAPYIGIGGDIGFASAQIGVRGEVVLDAPVVARAGGLLRGNAGGFYGELNVGVGIKPTLDLALIPYVKAQFGSLDPWEDDLTQINQPLGEIFEFEWGGKYVFGDQSRKENGPIQRIDAPSAQQRPTQRESKPSLGIGNGGGTARNLKGGPQIEGGSEVAAQQRTGEGSMDKVMETVDSVIALVEGIGAMGELVSLIIGLITATATFGPAGFIVYLVWKIFKGELSWDGLKESVNKVVRALQAAGDLLRKHMPDWFNNIVDVFTGDKPGLLDALFGADDRMREAVGRGDHVYAPFDMHVEMVNTLKGGYFGDGDAQAIAAIFRVSGGRGELASLVSRCGGAGEFIDGWTTFFDDAPIKRIFRQYGINW